MSVDEKARLQLARTSFGSAMGLQAAKAAAGQAGKDLAGPWLLAGVVVQHCAACGASFYPARPLCSHCLSEKLDWKPGSPKGKLLSFTTLHVSLNDLFRKNGPWLVGLVALASEGNIYAFMDESVANCGQEVELFTAPDATGEAIFIAVQPGEKAQGQARHIAEKLAALKMDSLVD